MDDVAAIAKVAASSVDDVASAAAEASSKTAGVVIDDAAVSPKYVQGFRPERELPIIFKIARGSLINKLVILMPGALLLNEFAPGAITPILMAGGTYLCFEGAEKVFHAVFPHDHAEGGGKKAFQGSAEELEEVKVKGAVKTDFILSAEIMTISLSAIPESTFMVEAGALAVVAVGVTVAIYGVVGLIIKMDDVGLALAKRDSPALKAIGRGLVRGMPVLLKVLSVVGTAAMLWVGGSILVHGLHELGVHHPYEDIHHLAVAAGERVPSFSGGVEWLVTAACDGVLGLLYGLLIIPLVTRLLVPAWRKLRPTG